MPARILCCVVLILVPRIEAAIVGDYRFDAADPGVNAVKGHLPAIHFGQTQIQENNVRLVRLQLGQGVQAVENHGNLVAVVPQQPGRDLGLFALILDNQNPEGT